MESNVPIYRGDQEVSSVELGDQTATAVFVGTTQIWPDGVSMLDEFVFADAGAFGTVSSAGVVSVTVVTGTLASFTPATFPVTTSVVNRTVSVTVNVPTGYSNTGSTVTGNISALQSPVSIPSVTTLAPQQTASTFYYNGW